MENSSFPSLPPPPASTENKAKRFSAILIVAILLIGLVAGGLTAYIITYTDFNSKLTNLENQLGISTLNGNATNYSNSVYFLGDNVSLSNLYSQVKTSVVVIQDLVPQYNLFGRIFGYSLQQGSGFATAINNQQIVVTNNHVIENSINVTVTFATGECYPATVLGTDPLADLAILSVTQMPTGIKSLALADSDSLQVGDPVVAVGSPYGLSGTLTTGVISALGRTIVEDSGTDQNGLTIPDIIQTSTAINPGNSGGPLITYNGEVVGITTAGISNSESLGFAIPSNTLKRELNALVSSGSYDQHPSINAVGTDMNYQIAQAMGTTITYGWLVESVSTTNGLQGGNTQATILGSRYVLGGDIIIAINNQRITNTDDLFSHLERNTLPGQTANFTVVRGGQTQTISITIGKTT